VPISRWPRGRRTYDICRVVEQFGRTLKYANGCGHPSGIGAFECNGPLSI
jgi:hypothetical protein